MLNPTNIELIEWLRVFAKNLYARPPTDRHRLDLIAARLEQAQDFIDAYDRTYASTDHHPTVREEAAVIAKLYDIKREQQTITAT